MRTTQLLWIKINHNFNVTTTAKQPVKNYFSLKIVPYASQTLSFVVQNNIP